MTLNIRCNHLERSIPVRWTGAVIRPFSLVQLADFFLLITNKKWLIVIVYFSFWVGDLFVMSLFYLFATVINLPGYMIRKRNKKKRNSLMLKSQGSRIPHSRANYIVCNNQGTVCSVLRQDARTGLEQDRSRWWLCPQKNMKMNYISSRDGWFSPGWRRIWCISQRISDKMLKYFNTCVLKPPSAHNSAILIQQYWM